MRRGPHWARVSRARSALTKGLTPSSVARVADVDDHAEPVGAHFVHEGHVVPQVHTILVGEPDGGALEFLEHVDDCPLRLFGDPEVADHHRCAHFLGDAGCGCGLLDGRSALPFVRGGVLDGRAVEGDYFDALLAALPDNVGRLLAVAEVEVFGGADPAHLDPANPGVPNGRYMACAQGSFIIEKSPGRGAQSPGYLVGGIRQLAHGGLLLLEVLGARLYTCQGVERWPAIGAEVALVEQFSEVVGRVVNEGW